MPYTMYMSIICQEITKNKRLTYTKIKHCQTEIPKSGSQDLEGSWFHFLGEAIRLNSLEITSKRKWGDKQKYK